VQWEDGRPIVQVCPELVLVDHGFQVPIGCGDNSDVEADGPIPAHPLKFLLLSGRNSVPPSAGLALMSQ